MKKIGLLGGSFNPIHLGHVALAKAVRKAFALQEIWFLPTAETPLKDQELVSFAQRAQMVRLAIKPYRYLKALEIEATLPQPSYTINTVRKLNKLHPGCQFYWIIGYDQYLQLDKWYKIVELKKEIQFIVVNRSSEKIDTEFLELSDFSHPANSTAIREGDFRYLYPTVRNYIEKEVLYFSDFLPRFYEAGRWQHALSVAEWSVRIAKQYRIDEKIALLAGYLHDMAKQMSREDMLPVMEIYFPEKLDYDEKVWHQYLAYYQAKYDFGIKNRQLLQAIANHTTATDRAVFSKILYCADKIDESRTYDTTYFRRLVLTDLNKAFQEIHEVVEDYRLRRKQNGS